MHSNLNNNWRQYKVLTDNQNQGFEQDAPEIPVLPCI